ncbi:hypothetical protein [Accumulibacter sp.]|uniref:hypothetical protein n=1 Tax=Accumulibacter sp. TaxID=2053492 RepID=UPI003453F7D0
MPGRRLVVLDPLQPLCALDLNVPDDAQFVCSRLATLAAGTGAPVIVSHRFARREASTPEQAREAVRGTGGLLDGVRSVCALWNPKEKQAKTICKTLGEPFERGRVLMGGVVKANGRANLRVTTFLRDARGLLVDRSQDVLRTRATDVDLRPALKATIARAATEGEPYTKTRGNGVYERRHELPEHSHSIGKRRPADRVGTLLDREERHRQRANRALQGWRFAASGRRQRPCAEAECWRGLTSDSRAVAPGSQVPRRRRNHPGVGFQVKYTLTKGSPQVQFHP